jgi:hypothetical protein
VIDAIGKIALKDRRFVWVNPAFCVETSLRLLSWNDMRCDRRRARGVPQNYRICRNRLESVSCGLREMKYDDWRMHAGSICACAGGK